MCGDRCGALFKGPLGKRCHSLSEAFRGTSQGQAGSSCADALRLRPEGEGRGSHLCPGQRGVVVTGRPRPQWFLALPLRKHTSNSQQGCLGPRRTGAATPNQPTEMERTANKGWPGCGDAGSSPAAGRKVTRLQRPVPRAVKRRPGASAPRSAGADGGDSGKNLYRGSWRLWAQSPKAGTAQTPVPR